MTNYLAPLKVQPSVKRKAFFSFHYADIMRVNNVRNAWKISHPESGSMRGFYDGSLWESKKLEGPEAVKRLIRDGCENTSAICVLIGTYTWQRRWVRYEIARSIIDKRGLLGVHINSLAHHQSRIPDTLGPNPLDYMAVAKYQDGASAAPRYYMFEWKDSAWRHYQDYQQQIEKPSWLPEPTVGGVMQLSVGAALYDYYNGNGHQHIGSWIDKAALTAGR